MTSERAKVAPGGAWCVMRVSFSRLFFIGGGACGQGGAVIIFFYTILLVSTLFKELICLVVFSTTRCRGLTGSLRRQREGVGTTEKRVVSEGKIILTAGEAMYAVSIVRGRVGSPRRIVTTLYRRLKRRRRGVQGGMRGISSVRGVGAGIRGRAKSEVHGLSLTKMGMSRSFGECCPCSAFTSEILKFANKSGRKVVKLRMGCRRMLGKASKAVLAIASTEKIRLRGMTRSEVRPITKGALRVDLSRGVRGCYRRTTGGIRRRGRTSDMSMLLVGPRSKRVFTVMGAPRFGLGAPFRLVSISRGARRASRRTRRVLGRV